MGTILFLIFRLVFGYNAPGDAQAISITVSLDSIALILLLYLKSKRN